MNNLIADDAQTYEAIMSYGDEYKLLMSKTKKKLELNFDMEDAFEILEGRVNVFGFSSGMEKLKKVTEFSVKKDDWLITGQRDYGLIVRMIRKRHPKSDRIRRKINDCLEFGIIDGVFKRTLQVSGIAFIVLVERFFEDDHQIINKWNYILSHKKTNISLEDFNTTFKLLVYGLVISFVVSIIQIIQFEYFN